MKEHWSKAWQKVFDLCSSLLVTIQRFSQYAHYGSDTNNFIESWHSKLRRNYIGQMQKQRVDYLIKILTQDVEPDYVHSYVCIGLGFKG
jgi:hypothetical protein